MHHHSKNEERAVNLSFLNVSGPGVFFRVESNEAAGSTPGGALRHFSQVSACDHTALPCFGDHSRLVGLSCNLLHHLNQSIGDGHGKCGELSDRRDVQPETHPD